MSQHHDESIHAAEPGHGHEGAVKTYTVIFIGLLLLAGLTVAAAFVDLGRWLPGHYWGLLVAFTIAGIKGLLIILYFMHVLKGPRRAVIFACAGFVWLSIMLMLTWADYGTRRDPAELNPKGEPRYLWQTGDRHLPPDAAAEFKAHG
jgi:cytochrome c oxidase subunit 4